MIIPLGLLGSGTCILKLVNHGCFLTLILSPLENLVLIFLEFLYILYWVFLKFAWVSCQDCLSFFQKLGFWWKYWRTITNFCMFYANLTAVYTILGKKYLKTIWHFVTHKVFFCKKFHVLKNSRSLMFLTKLALSFWAEAEKFRFFLLEFFWKC